MPRHWKRQSDDPRRAYGRGPEACRRRNRVRDSEGRRIARDRRVDARAFEKQLPCPSDADGQAAFGNSETDEELAITLAQICKIRDNVHELTDAVIAAMTDKMFAQRYPAPPGIDWTARVLAGIAAAAAIASLVLVART